MCDEKNCNPTDEERRAFLIGTGTTLLTVAAGQRVLAGQSAAPPTRVLDNPKIQHGKVMFKRGAGEIDGYLARPKANGRFRSVLVIAGNRITEEYIPNTCAALAVAGYIGLAPNIFHTVPDSAQTPDQMAKALEGRSEDEYLDDIRAGAAYLKAQKFVKSGTAVLGFCSGGRRAMLYSDRFQDTKAVIPYHPGRTLASEITHIKAPVQIHSGTADRHIPVAWIRELEEAFRKQGTIVEAYLYDGADHGFLAYTRPYYRPDHAQLAWKRTIEFLNKRLK